MLTPEERRAKIGAVVRVASGNFLEMYDFIVYGYYAVYIGNAFFPSHSKFASLMLSLMTFGIGFLMRPLGAVFLGAYIDRKGRREGLLLTLGLMAFGTLTIALTPDFKAIGLAAPLIILVPGFASGFQGISEAAPFAISRESCWCSICWASATKGRHDPPAIVLFRRYDGRISRILEHEHELLTSVFAIIRRDAKRGRFAYPELGTRNAKLPPLSFFSLHQLRLGLVPVCCLFVSIGEPEQSSFVQFLAEDL
jgi:Sugar (and other) transporter